MSGLLDKVDLRTKLVGENRLELLTFRLNGSQLFAINVFKVREVMALPALHQLPHANSVVSGVVHLRGQTVPVIDLSMAIGRQPLRDRQSGNLIVTEYNRKVQAFIVGPVERIVNLNWEAIQPPPRTSGRGHFLTAITQLNDRIVEIIDVERVLAQIIHFATDVSPDLLQATQGADNVSREILLVDDSATAVDQVRHTLAQMGLTILVESDGRRALNRLQRWADEGINVAEKLLMVITDAEMPVMDGYRLTSEIRQDPRLRDLYVVLHTSLSGSFNQAMVQKVGCDDFLSKFHPNDLAVLVHNRIRQLSGASD